MARIRKVIIHVRQVLIKKESVKSCNYKAEISLHTDDQRERILRISERTEIENFKMIHSISQNYREDLS